MNTICRRSQNRAVCECIPGYYGNPSGSGCHAECTISADCSRDKACVNNKCVDPCPGVCGQNGKYYTTFLILRQLVAKFLLNLILVCVFNNK